MTIKNKHDILQSSRTNKTQAPHRATGRATGREGKKMQIGNEYCDNKEIFYIEDRDGYYWINGSEGYPKKDWLLSDAVQHYKSEDAKAERFISDWNAWCG